MDRRPLKTRERSWAKSLARFMVQRGVSPNAISVLSIFFAAVAGAAFLYAALGTRHSALVLGVAAACIQLRLLCNMLDGMVAIEGGKASPSGAIFNELPDRVADVLILVPAGYAALTPELGWGATLLALFTAYVRVLGGSLGLAQDFRGPMAKPHRMAVLTVAALAQILVSNALSFGLAIIILGSILTIGRRTHRMLRELKSR